MPLIFPSACAFLEAWVLKLRIPMDPQVAMDLLQPDGIVGVDGIANQATVLVGDRRLTPAEFSPSEQGKDDVRSISPQRRPSNVLVSTAVLLRCHWTMSRKSEVWRFVETTDECHYYKEAK